LSIDKQYIFDNKKSSAATEPFPINSSSDFVKQEAIRMNLIIGEEVFQGERKEGLPMMIQK
jgi:hypothetical protein